MNWFDELSQWFDAVENNMQLIWDKSVETSSNLTALNHEIQSLTQFVHNLQTYSVIILIALGIQFVIIVWLLAGQSAMKRKLENIEVLLTVPREGITNGNKNNCG